MKKQSILVNYLYKAQPRVFTKRHRVQLVQWGESAHFTVCSQTPNSSSPKLCVLLSCWWQENVELEMLCGAYWCCTEASPWLRFVMHLRSSQSPVSIPPYPNFACGYSFNPKGTSKMGDDGRYWCVNSVPVAIKNWMHWKKKVEQESSNPQDPSTIPPAL